jgi:two-component system, NtrC family, response regulator AtoC
VKSLLLVLSVVRHRETRALALEVLEGAGHRVIESESYTQALSLLSNGLVPDLVLVEPAGSGAPEHSQYIQLLNDARPESICLVLGMGEQRQREEAAKHGVRHYLLKPVTRGDVESMAEELILPDGKGEQEERRISAARLAAVAPEAPGAPLIEELGDDRYFLAASPAMLEIHRQAKLLADVDVTVLILGESGTGKEVIAQLIHKYSRRSRQKLLNVNCAALPAELLESELFGYQQGAFTGAVKDRAGRFEQAHRGTLLLDEIGEISAQMQAKLLHVLQGGHFTRLGAQESTKVDVRILAATNVQMEAALDQKTFREDLYYRLSAFTIHVPPLRERREEIPYLIEETVRRTPAEMKNGSGFRLSSRLIDSAVLYDWRGNLRELRNFVTRTIIMRDQDAAVRELETKIASRGISAQASAEAEPGRCSGMRSIVRDIKDRTEVRMIQEALDAAGWNRRHAAQHLNISYRALLYKIQQYRLAPRLTAGASEKLRSAYSARSNAM